MSDVCSWYYSMSNMRWDERMSKFKMLNSFPGKEQQQRKDKKSEILIKSLHFWLFTCSMIFYFYAVWAVLCWSEILVRQLKSFKFWCSSPPFLLTFSDLLTWSRFTYSSASNNRRTSFHPHPSLLLLSVVHMSWWKYNKIREDSFPIYSEWNVRASQTLFALEDSNLFTSIH